MRDCPCDKTREIRGLSTFAAPWAERPGDMLVALIYIGPTDAVGAETRRPAVAAME